MLLCLVFFTSLGPCISSGEGAKTRLQLRDPKEVGWKERLSCKKLLFLELSGRAEWVKGGFLMIWVFLLSSMSNVISSLLFLLSMCLRWNPRGKSAASDLLLWGHPVTEGESADLSPLSLGAGFPERWAHTASDAWLFLTMG